MKQGKLLIKGACQVVRVCGNREMMLIGEAMKKIDLIKAENGNGLSVVVDSEGIITDIGTDEDIGGRYHDCSFVNIIDGQGCCVLPGLIDAHTHPVWDGDRVHEFALKLSGASYMEIHEAGGGIHYSVDHTRNASEDRLYELFKQRLLRMIRCGTTLVECKSGYGLNTETELKMLRVIERARRDDEVKIDISSTYCGAHAIPKGLTPEEATQDVLENQIPAVKAAMDSGSITVDNIDVFCEKGVFNVDQTRRILEAGQKCGMKINFHGEELNLLHSAEMGASLRASAISHLIKISDAGIEAMSRSLSVAVILPTTAYILRFPSPPVRKMIEQGVPVALGSDFNPNDHCLSMPVTMHLACVNQQMTMSEALVASTINAAASLGMSNMHGSLEVGKKANILLVEAPRWEHIIYQFAGHDEIIKAVICGGDISYQRS